TQRVGAVCASVGIPREACVCLAACRCERAVEEQIHLRHADCISRTHLDGDRARDGAAGGGRCDRNSWRGRVGWCGAARGEERTVSVDAAVTEGCVESCGAEIIGGLHQDVDRSEEHTAEL